MLRTHTCGELRISDVNKNVSLAGWVQVVRDKGGIIYIDLRDRYGITQITMVGGIAPRLLPYLSSPLQQKIQYQHAAPGLGALSFAKQQWQQEQQP